MSKREQIILGITIVVVLLAGVFLLVDTSSSKKKIAEKGVTLKELKSFVNDMTKIISTNDFSDKDAYIIDKATAPWENDPFSTIDLPKESKSKTDEEETMALSYTGYVQIGKQLLAVINGSEYNVGEELGEPGYVVYSISPEKVIVRVGNRKMIALPLEDTM